MKKLIKSGVCGTYEQCIYALFTNDRSIVAAEEKKKKKKRENADAARLSAIQTYTRPLISHVKKKTNFVNFDQISQSYHIESLSIPTFLCKIKYSTELIKQ